MDIKTPTKNKHNKHNPQKAHDLLPQDSDSLRILHQRAELLAKRADQILDENDLIPYIVFRLGAHDCYGIPYQYAKEVIYTNMITRVPFVPTFITGVINRWGMLIAILDLHEFFKLPTTPHQTMNTHHIILVTFNNITMGILVDHIEGSNAYNPHILHLPLISANKTISDYIVGLHNGVVAIINIAAIVSDISLQMSHQSEQLTKYRLNISAKETDDSTTHS